MTNRNFASILDELDKFVPDRDKHVVVESRARNVIASAINLLKMIEESFSPEDADELHRRLLNSIKGEDENKFIRKIREFKDRDDAILLERRRKKK
jgi:hypothetical protein